MISNEQLELQKYILYQIISWYLREISGISQDCETNIRLELESIAKPVLDLASLVETNPELALMGLQDF